MMIESEIQGDNWLTQVYLENGHKTVHVIVCI